MEKALNPKIPLVLEKDLEQKAETTPGIGRPLPEA